MNLYRRSFLKTTAIAASSAVISKGRSLTGEAASFTPGPGNKWPGRVAINFNKDAVADLTKPQDEVIAKMVDDAVLALTGKSDLGDAWKEIFPATLSLLSKIVIKINTANTQLPAPHLSSVRAIIDGLLKMTIDGTDFPGGNITIYDMDFNGGMDKLGYTKTNFPEIALGYTRLVDGGDGAMNNHKYASILSEADFLINVFSPRGHTYPPLGSRFTLGFKSHIGTYASEPRTEGPSLHDTLMENLVEMNCTGPVYTKNVLSVCSGIFGLNEGVGPPGQAQDYKTYAKTMDASISGSANPTTIMVSTDPVAIEMQTIKMMRLNKSGKFSVEDMPPYLQATAGISGAMPSTYNIGIIDEAQMDIRRVINGETGIVTPKRSKTAEQGIQVRVPGSSATFIEFILPGTISLPYATITLHSVDGKLVKRQRIPIRGVRNHFSWDHKNSSGSTVGKGTYIIRIVCGKTRLSESFTIV